MTMLGQYVFVHTLLYSGSFTLSILTMGSLHSRLHVELSGTVTDDGFVDFVVDFVVVVRVVDTTV